MSLQLKSSAYAGNACRSIYFSDTSGLYDVTTNPTGWGTPNLAIGSVTETHIIITLPDTTTVVNILNPVGLPTSDTLFEYEITAAVVNGGTYISDGLYQIEYTVTDGITTYTTGANYFLFTCNIECCVSKLFAKIATIKDCSCDDFTITNALYANALLKGLQASKDCGNITQINALITKLNKICNLSSSDCGCSN